MKFRPQSIALFLAGTITSAASQQADPSDPLVVNSTDVASACSSIPFTSVEGYPLFQLPFIEDCLASVPVDKDNMIQHVSALKDTLAYT
jgi:hypothetical protein